MLNNLSSVDVAPSLAHLPAFMINFEIIYKCNLDCSYCPSHDNNTEPTPLEKCKKTIDFIFEYTDAVLGLKLKHERRAALNLIGGEPFAHPDIIDILEYIRDVYTKKYQDHWKLSVCVTTNGLIGSNAMEKSIGLIDYWTVSYHTETLPKQKELSLTAIKTLHTCKQNFEVRVMSPVDAGKFQEAKAVHSELVSLGINALMKPIHNDQYSSEQTNYFKIFWKSKHKDQISEYNTSSGITCCSNRPLILNSDKSNSTNFIHNNKFQDWYCTLNLNYLFVDHLFNVYHNISCRVSSLTNKLEPIGNFNNYNAIIKTLHAQINHKSVPVVKCPKEFCVGCGMCATKSQNKTDLIQLMKNHLVDVSILDFKDT